MALYDGVVSVNGIQPLWEANVSGELPYR